MIELACGALGLLFGFFVGRGRKKRQKASPPSILGNTEPLKQAHREIDDLRVALNEERAKHHEARREARDNATRVSALKMTVTNLRDSVKYWRDLGDVSKPQPPVMPW